MGILRFLAKKIQFGKTIGQAAPLAAFTFNRGNANRIARDKHRYQAIGQATGFDQPTDLAGNVVNFVIACGFNFKIAGDDHTLIIVGVTLDKQAIAGFDVGRWNEMHMVSLSTRKRGLNAAIFLFNHHRRLLQRKNTMHRSLLLLFVSLSLSVPVSSLANPSPVTFTQRKVEQRFGSCKQPEMNSECALIQVEYPEFTAPSNPKLAQTINQHLMKDILNHILLEDEPYPTLDIAVKEYGKLYLSSKPYDGMSERLGWNIEIDGKVYFQSNGLVSVGLKSTGFLGGAHPLTQVYYYNFDLHTGQVLKVTDLLAQPTAAEKLNQMGEKYFRQARDLKPTADLEGEGLEFPKKHFQLNNNFCFTPQGMIFYFNPYEIAAYAYGPTKITIPYAELKPLLKAAVVKDLQQGGAKL